MVLNDAMVNLIEFLVSGLIALIASFLRSRQLTDAQRALVGRVEAAAQHGVKATAQLVESKRTADGKLLPPDARDAKLFALQAAKSVLSSEELVALQKKYGLEGTDAMILTLLESKLLDHKLALPPKSLGSPMEAAPDPAKQLPPSAPEPAPPIEEKPLAPTEG